MIVTLCGNPTNEADCGYCLQSKDCREVRETICRGCIREGKCPEDFRHKKVSAGMCRGRELEISTQMRTPEIPDIRGMLKSERENIIKRLSEPFSKETVEEMKRIKDLHERELTQMRTVDEITRLHGKGF